MLKRALIALLFTLGLHSVIHAAVQQDQSFTGTPVLALTFGGSQYLAQSYTAGLTGTLSKVSFQADGQGIAQVEIREMVNGEPSSTVLGSATFNLIATNTALTEVPLPTPVQQVAGAQYAIVLLIPANGTSGGGEWVGRFTDSYAAGTSFVGFNNGTTWGLGEQMAGPGADFYFQTFVDVQDAAAPVVNVLSPYEAAAYRLRDQVQAIYSCSDDVAIASCTGTVPNGSLIDTKSLGSKQFTITAVDSAGKTTVRTINYRVIASERIPPGRGKP